MADRPAHQFPSCSRSAFPVSAADDKASLETDSRATVMQWLLRRGAGGSRQAGLSPSVGEH